jgi:hypothetical protein
MSLPRFRAFHATAALLVAIIGCGEKLPEFGQVSGVVTAKGQPLKGMIVTFMPDPSKGNELPYNGTGRTDDEGRYTLEWGFKGEKGQGAAVGWNKVVVIDTRYSSIPQGAPVPPRLFPPNYGLITSTPLAFEVKPGPQTIDLKLD